MTNLAGHGGYDMDTGFTINGVHHLRLTVTDVARARDFYTGVLGFQVIAEFGSTVLVGAVGFFIGLGPANDPTRAGTGDRFDENRVGLDHLSFGVASRTELEAAARRFDELGVPHGGVVDLGPDFRLFILAFRDPDNIQLELSAGYDQSGGGA